MPHARQQLGAWGEKVARTQLEAHGYTIEAANWRCRQGEIDLVARKNEQLAFVEVRSRRGTGKGRPEESITPRKARKLWETALMYLSTHDLDDVDWQIDLMAVELKPDGTLIRCEHIPNFVTGDAF